MEKTEPIKLYIIESSSSGIKVKEKEKEEKEKEKEKVIFLSFADALTSLVPAAEMEEWTECEDHRNMILTRRYRKEANGSVSVLSLRKSGWRGP